MGSEFSEFFMSGHEIPNKMAVFDAQNTLLKRTLRATLKAFLPPDMISAVLESGTVKHLLILLIFQLQNKHLFE